MAAFANLPVDLVIVRHGQSEANLMSGNLASGDPSGQLAFDAMQAAMRHDSQMRLTDVGREQARCAGKWLRENAGTFDDFYCSQYTRTKETAAELGLEGANWSADLMIRERDQGVHDGPGSTELSKKLDDEEKFRRAKSHLYWQPVAGESVADIVLRVRLFLAQVTNCSAGMRVIVVCHYRVIQAFRLLLEEIPQEDADEMLREPMPNCCIWWYSRRDLGVGRVHAKVTSVRRIAVQPDGTAQEERRELSRRTFTNESLLQQVERIPQIINNAPDGSKACFVVATPPAKKQKV